MGKDYGYPSFELICKASSGDEMAFKEILEFYDAYIFKLCLHPFHHSESGKVSMQVDEELTGEIYTDMMKAISTMNLQKLFVKLTEKGGK